MRRGLRPKQKECINYIRKWDHDKKPIGLVIDLVAEGFTLQEITKILIVIDNRCVNTKLCPYIGG